MQNQNETLKINEFLNLVAPLVFEITKKVLQSFGWQVIQKGSGLDTVFSIKAGDKEVEFYLHNLLLEIATVDRDEEPLVFDERLRDFDYFVEKAARITESKLKILFKLLAEENADTAIEKITQMAKDYQRIRIWKIDQNPQV
jgi:hypothetical protein